MKTKMFLTPFLRFVLIGGLFMLVSCTSENSITEQDDIVLQGRHSFQQALDCNIEPDGPIVLGVGETITLTGDPGGYTGGVSYFWEVVDEDCARIVGNNTNNMVTVEAIACGCETFATLEITPDEGPQPASYCNASIQTDPCFVIPDELCSEFSETPKWFPSCFGTCSGNLDHVVEIHHQLCNLVLPEGYTSSIYDVQLSSGTTFGNCSDCDDPILEFPVGEGSTSFNMAICGPLNHSMLIDIAIHDPDGNVLAVFPNNYFSFFIPECEF